MSRILSNREEMVVNRLRASGCTIKEVAGLFEVTPSAVQEADPMRKAYKRGYNKAWNTLKKQSRA